MRNKENITTMQDAFLSWRIASPVLILLLICFAQAKAQQKIVAIGDSNGASKIGWVNQLKSLRPADSIFNYSVSGNTIGFDNLGDEKLNTLKNIDNYLADAKARSINGSIDDVVILLGTNDCKQVFSEREKEVVENLKILIKLIKEKQLIKDSKSEVYIVSPPPFGEDNVLKEKYKGGNQRVRKLLPEFMNVALEADCHFIDIYHELKPTYIELNTDGVHLNKMGSKMVANSISRFLDNTTRISWDDTHKNKWPASVQVVDIASPLDGVIQKAYFYKSSKSEPQPLVVSLHTWSGNYNQRDELLGEVLIKDWNYIHPDFRGPNNTVKACGSKYAIDDIDQAIAFAIKHGHVDPNNIHVLGASGGGYASLFMFMNSKHNIASFSAWVPISDIEAWYYESAGRRNKYAGHILSATESADSILNVKEARLRSPLYMKTPTDLRRKSILNIYAGVHDGYSGSVPITQSLNFYNKVIKDFGAQNDNLISQKVMLDMVTMRGTPMKSGNIIGDRQVIFQQSYKNISLTIFEGKHEMLTNIALNLLPIKHEN